MLLRRLLLLILASVLALAQALSTRPTCPAVEVVRSFQEKIDRRQFEQAALLLTDDAVISTPFGKKTKEHFLKRLQSRNGPVWGESAMGEHERQCVTEGTRKFGIVKVKLKRVVEIDDENRINKITVTKK